MITTKRLTLRAPRTGDAAAVTKVMQDIEVTRWLTNPPYPYTLADAESFIAKDHGENVYFIEDAQRVCGCISLNQGLGYWLARDRWGLGYMSEAAIAVVAHHFGETDVPLRGGYLVGNGRSRAILEKVGFRDDFVKSVFIPALGEDVDVQKMLLSRSDWEART